MLEVNPNSQTTPQELVTAPTAAIFSPNETRIAEITTEILQQKALTVQSIVQIGKLLDEAKGYLKKEGQWLKWLKINVDISVRMAQRYIQLSKAFPDATSVSHLGMTKALSLLALPEAQREAFISEPHEVNGQQKTVSDMSVREIRHVIHEKIKPVKTDNTAVKGAGESSSILNVVHNPNLNNRKSPEIQPKQSDLRVLTDDIVSAQIHLDNIMKVLKEQASDDVGQGRIADDLRSLHNKILQCLNLAKLEIPAN